MFASAETITAIEAATSASTSRYAARMANDASGSRSRKMEIALLERPTTATARTRPLCTCDGSLKRRTPSTSTTAATISSNTVLSTVARISRRRSPNVRRAVARRRADLRALRALVRVLLDLEERNDHGRRDRARRRPRQRRRSDARLEQLRRQRQAPRQSPGGERHRGGARHEDARHGRAEGHKAR